MAIKRETGLTLVDNRYVFDFGQCTYGNGWAQLDSRQDASYYGNWVNPTTRQLFSYCEGDTTLITCETDAEFTEQVMSSITWHREAGYGGAIDPGFSEEMKARFVALGLGEVLH